MMKSMLKLFSKHSVKYLLLMIMSYASGLAGVIIMFTMHGMLQALPLIISGVIMIVLFALAGAYNDSNYGHHNHHDELIQSKYR